MTPNSTSPSTSSRSSSSKSKTQSRFSLDKKPVDSSFVTSALGALGPQRVSPPQPTKTLRSVRSSSAVNTRQTTSSHSHTRSRSRADVASNASTSKSTIPPVPPTTEKVRKHMSVFAPTTYSAMDTQQERNLRYAREQEEKQARLDSLADEWNASTTLSRTHLPPLLPLTAHSASSSALSSPDTHPHHDAYTGMRSRSWVDLPASASRRDERDYGPGTSSTSHGGVPVPPLPFLSSPPASATTETKTSRVRKRMSLFPIKGIPIFSDLNVPPQAEPQQTLSEQQPPSLGKQREWYPQQPTPPPTPRTPTVPPVPHIPMQSSKPKPTKSITPKSSFKSLLSSLLLRTPKPTKPKESEEKGKEWQREDISVTVGIGMPYRPPKEW